MSRSRLWLSTALIAALLSTAARASDIGHELADRVSLETYRYYLDELLFTRLGNDRRHGRPDNLAARENIVATFESFGLEVERHFFLSSARQNIVATKVGRLYPQAQFIIGAHYDSASNPGADDDASGVAGLLELARILSECETAFTVKFIAFDMEEASHFGSEGYVADHPRDEIRGMIQLDTIAWDGIRPRLSRVCSNDNDPFVNSVAASILEYGNGLSVLATSNCGFAGSDHDSFQAWPACLLVEADFFDNPCHHEPCDSVDTPDYIDYEFAGDNVRSVAGFLADHARAEVWESACGGLVWDCNGNGRSDLCDIATGDSADANRDGIPDDCQADRTHYVDDDAPEDPGPGDPDVSDPLEDGSPAHPFDTLGEAIEAASEDHIVVLADGLYRGAQNRNLALPRGTGVRSMHGPAGCIIDCQDSGYAFICALPSSQRGWAGGIDGLTILNANYSSVWIVGGNAEIANCVFRDNRSQRGAAIQAGGGVARIIGCTFSNNQATEDGGAVWAQGAVEPGVALLISPLEIRRCSFDGNTCGRNGGSIFVTYLAAGMDDCVLNGSTAQGGGAIAINFCTATLSGCSISGNTASGSGAGVYVTYYSDVRIVDSDVYENEALQDGGAIWCETGSHLHVERASIQGNRALSGGGIGLRDIGSAAISNCLIADNDAAQGGGLYCANQLAGQVPVLIHYSTLADNRADARGGGLAAEGDCLVTGSDSILWGNSAPLGPQVSWESVNGELTLRYSDVQGGMQAAELQGAHIWENNLDTDPLFADSMSGDYHLSPNSPCIDAADPVFVPAALTRDIDGEARIWAGRSDMGADEAGSYPWGDLNCDGEFDAGDVRWFVLALTSPEKYSAQLPHCDRLMGDLDGDRDLDAFDIHAFIALLASE